MGDPRRFHAFASLIARHLPNSLQIADVAGGKGILQASLRERGYRHITTWDRRPRTRYTQQGHRYGYFTHTTESRFDAIVAMHPDSATDHCILFAGHHRIPALICPCCIKPSAELFRGAYKYHGWCAHLEAMATRIGLSVTWDRLPINGRNDVMILSPITAPLHA